MITTSRLSLTVWDLGSDPYSHLQLAANWQTIDDLLLKRTGDTATGTMRVAVGAVGTEAIGVKLTADASARIKIHPDAVYLGDGTGTFDVKFYRGAADKLTLDDQLEVNISSAPSFLSSNGSSVALEGYKVGAQTFVENRLLSTDAQPSFRILGSGELNYGVGGSTTTDVRVYRSASQTLTIENNLKVTNLEATNSITIGGVLLNISGGSIQSNASLITANVIRARDGFTGRTQLGDASDNTRSIIYFGGGADVNLYRDGVDRLKTDDSLITLGFLQVNSTATKSIEAEGGIDIAGISVLTGAVTMGSTASVAGTLTVTGGSGVSGRTPIATNTLLGDVLRGKQLWLESTTNSNLWYLADINSDLSFRTTTFSAGGPGGSDTERFKISSTGVVTFTGTVNAGAITSTGLTVSGSGSFTGNLNITGTVTSGATTTGNVSASAITSSSINNSGTVTTGTLTASNGTIGNLSTTSITTGGINGFAGNVNIFATVSITGTLGVASNATISGNLVVGGSLTAGGSGHPIQFGSSLAGPVPYFEIYGAINVNPNSGGSIQCYVPLVGNAGMYSTFYASSDEANKISFKDIDKSDIVERFKTVPVQSWKWNKKTREMIGNEQRHIGPTAQAFEEAFGLGVVTSPNDEKFIDMTDYLGVIFTVLQDVAQRLESLEEKSGE